METVSIPKDVFTKILADVETLIDDVELALDTIVQKRIHDIETNNIKGKTEQELNDYLKRRGVKVEWMDYQRTSRLLQRFR